MDKNTSIIVGIVVALSLLFGGFVLYKKHMESVPEPKDKIQIEIGQKGDGPAIRIETEREKKQIRVWPFVNIQTENEKKK